MKNHFQKQFRYNFRANKKLIELIRKNNIADKKILSIMSHIVSVEELWLERLKETPNYLMDTWEIFSIQEIEVLAGNSLANWLKFIKRINKKRLGEISCTFTNSEGKECTNLYVEIMQHVINHSVFHRGQIGLLLKEKKVDIPPTDFLHFISSG